MKSIRYISQLIGNIFNSFRYIFNPFRDIFIWLKTSIKRNLIPTVLAIIPYHLYNALSQALFKYMWSWYLTVYMIAFQMPRAYNHFRIKYLSLPKYMAMLKQFNIIIALFLKWKRYNVKCFTISISLSLLGEICDNKRFHHRYKSSQNTSLKVFILHLSKKGQW